MIVLHCFQNNTFLHFKIFTEDFQPHWNRFTIFFRTVAVYPRQQKFYCCFLSNLELGQENSTLPPHSLYDKMVIAVSRPKKLRDILTRTSLTLLNDIKIQDFILKCKNACKTMKSATLFHSFMDAS